MTVPHWRFFFLSLICITLVLGSLRSFAEIATGSDKYAHAAAAFSVSTVTYVTMRRAKSPKWESLISSLALTTAIGVGKEIFDEKLSESDLVADLAGAGASFLICFTVDW